MTETSEETIDLYFLKKKITSKNSHISVYLSTKFMILKYFVKHLQRLLTLW